MTSGEANTAYPIAHQRTWRPYRVHPDAAELVRSAWEGLDDLCLYVHIPFCETRCFFCEYAVVERDQVGGGDPGGGLDGSINLFANGTLGTSYLLTQTPQLAGAA